MSVCFLEYRARVRLTAVRENGAVVGFAHLMGRPVKERLTPRPGAAAADVGGADCRMRWHAWWTCGYNNAFRDDAARGEQRARDHHAVAEREEKVCGVRCSAYFADATLRKRQAVAFATCPLDVCHP